MIKQFMRKPSAVRSLVAIVMSAALFSFSENVGVESFTIYLNDDVLMKEYVLPERVVGSISLDASRSADLLNVHYNHCGKIGSDRTVSLVNERMTALKVWKFAGDSPALMEIGIDDLVAAMGTTQQSLGLMYSSREIPKGQVLTRVTINGAKASLK